MSLEVLRARTEEHLSFPVKAKWQHRHWLDFVLTVRFRAVGDDCAPHLKYQYRST